VRLPPNSFLVPGRGAGIKGLGVWQWRNGSLYFSRWPRKQPTARTPAEAFNRETLYFSTQIVKIMDSYQIDFSRWLASQSQLAAQDFLYIALFGRIGHMVRRDGKVVYSMAAMQDVSKTLDAIWQLKGGLLMRGDPWWEGLPAGLDGQVLTMQDNGLFAWEFPAAPATITQQSQPVFTSFTASTDAFATQGTIYSVQHALNIDRLMLYAAPSAGNLYKGVVGLCSLSAGNYTLTSVVSGTPVQGQIPGADGWTQLDLPSSLAVSPGDNVFIGATRTNGTTTNPLQVGQGHGLAQSAPLPGRAAKSVNLASVNPAVGNVFTNRADIARGITVFWHE
jgi:hypothetical protein